MLEPHEEKLIIIVMSTLFIAGLIAIIFFPA